MLSSCDCRQSEGSKSKTLLTGQSFSFGRTSLRYIQGSTAFSSRLLPIREYEIGMNVPVQPASPMSETGRSDWPSSHRPGHGWRHCAAPARTSEARHPSITDLSKLQSKRGLRPIWKPWISAENYRDAPLP